MSEHNDALEKAAAFCEFYADERMTLAGDSILHDPLMRGGPFTGANMVKSRGCQIDGTINSAAYHAATELAAHIRSLKT